MAEKPQWLARVIPEAEPVRYGAGRRIGERAKRKGAGEEIFARPVAQCATKVRSFFSQTRFERRAELPTKLYFQDFP